MSIWLKLLIVAAGGAIGTLGRFLLEQITRVPYGLWLINVVGCLLMGFFFGLCVAAPWAQGVKSSFKLFFMVGFVGGFSSFAHYILYTANYFREGQFIYGWTYLLSTLVVGLLCVFAGMVAGMKCY